MQLPWLRKSCLIILTERVFLFKPQMSEIVGFDLKPEEDTSLAHMLEFGLGKYLTQLDEISAAASKEHSLEKALEKMQEEWHDIAFELVAYRDTVSASVRWQYHHIVLILI